MKKLNGFLWGLLAMVGVTFQSCDDDEGYSIGDIAVDWVTVNTQGAHVFEFMGDTWGRLWPAATNYPNYSPVDGQRAIIEFNPLYDNYPEGYDCSIKLTRVREILTKQVEELTTENEAEYGNDPVSIFEGNMWISGQHLNVIFNQNLPKEVKHRVSLVRNTTITPPEDGYIHLEYRYNTYDDTTDYRVYGAVSFSLRSLDITTETKGIKVKINSVNGGEKEITFDLKGSTAPKALEQLDYTEMEAV